MNINNIHDDYKVFNIPLKIKNKIFISFFNDLINFHYKNSKIYNKIINKISSKNYKYTSLKEMPFIPVRLFKEYDLLSISRKDIFKTMLSSGTSGNSQSKIYLDKDTSINQIKALNQIVKSFIGKKKLPMIILDSENILKDRKLFNARGAGILGFSFFASRINYVLNSDLSLNKNLITNFFKSIKNNEFIIYGFTSILWEIFNSNKKFFKNFNFSKAKIIHGGGWKKLNTKNITNIDFKNFLQKNYQIKNIYNYYGMIEQTGSIFFECECGYFVTSKYSEILIRDKNFNICKPNQKGIIQLFSTLPNSYPGHIILTEDEGMIVKNHICKFKRIGKHFKVFGRLKNAEIKGCSDAA